MGGGVPTRVYFYFPLIKGLETPTVVVVPRDILTVPITKGPWVLVDERGFVVF